MTNLARESLIASGANDQPALAHYLNKIDELVRKIEPAVQHEEVIEKARAMFEWLWASKPDRYQPGGNFRLTDVIDAHLDVHVKRVGNCLGLTLLYNVLAKQLGLEVKAVYLEEAFGGGPHVLSLLVGGAATTDVENTLPHGFDFKGHLSHPRRVVWGDRELVADICHSAGNESFERGEFERAVKSYSRALELNPGHGRARLNRGLALAQMGRDGAAARDLATWPSEDTFRDAR